MALNICVDKQSSPLELRKELKALIDTTELHLGGTGYLDYLWYDYAGRSLTYERKTVSDLSGRVDDLERQLMNALAVADHVGLIVEGTMKPSDGHTLLYNSSFKAQRPSPRPYAYYAGFEWRLMEAGIPVFFTANARATAHLLAEAVKLSNKPDSKVFNRCIKRRVDVGSTNPQVQNLVNLGLGEEKATVLVQQFGSIWNILHATDAEITAVEGVGKRSLEKLKELVGR